MTSAEFWKGLNVDDTTSEDFHSHYEQRGRQKRALENKYIPLALDKEACSALFSGSADRPYETTLHECTCMDFAIRGLPCKHMYRLAHELKLINLHELLPKPNKRVMKLQKEASGILSALKTNWEFMPESVVISMCEKLMRLKSEEDSISQQ